MGRQVVDRAHQSVGRDAVVARTDRAAPGPVEPRRRTPFSTRSSDPTAKPTRARAAAGPRGDERAVQRARRGARTAVHVERRRRRRHAVPAVRPRPRVALPLLDPSRVRAAPRMARARRTRHLHPRPRRVRPLHADHGRGRRRLGGRGGVGVAPSSAWRSGRSASRSASRTTTCSARGRATARCRTAGCVLVRPDRFVAWRSHDTSDDPAAALRAAMQQILDREGAPAQ